ARKHFECELFDNGAVADCLKKVDGDGARRHQGSIIAKYSGALHGSAQMRATGHKPPGGEGEHSLPAIDIHASGTTDRYVSISTLNPPDRFIRSAAPERAT